MCTKVTKRAVGFAKVQIWTRFRLPGDFNSSSNNNNDDDDDES
jgi:hypothetical protein